MKSKSAIALGTVAGLLVGAALLANQTGPTGENPRSRSQGERKQQTGSIFSLTRDQGPFLHGRKVSVAEAEVESGFWLLRPSLSLANDRNIRNVFIEQNKDDTGRRWAQVAVDYESGLLMIVLPAWVDGFDKDPKKEFQEVVDTYLGGPYARVITLHGVPALVIERNPPKGNAFVSLVINGTMVKMFGEYAPLKASQLSAAAESLNLKAGG